jgi:AraC-like DNA-binding protein
MDTLPTQERLTSAGEEKLCKRWHQFAEDSHFDARKMAGLCQVSVRHLGRIVKQEAGVTPREWLRLQRMRVALSCLQGSASIKEIAYMLHYLQVSRFCRDFRLQFGVTPSAHRTLRQTRGNQMTGTALPDDAWRMVSDIHRFTGTNLNEGARARGKIGA